MADLPLTGNAQFTIPIDDDDDDNQSQATIPIASDNDNDSTYGADSQSQTTSLASSIWEYHYENGRRYNASRKGTYWAPNDEPQADSMDINHHLYLLTLNGSLHLAPIPAYPNRILDIGTGTGIWAIDMGDRYPSASVIGNDLSPIQPSFVPPNVQFEVDDFCDTWTYTASTFDMIHARQMFGCVADYPKLYAEVLKALKPGGWFEQVEIDVVVQSEDGSIAGTGFEQWGPLSVEAGKKYGRSMRLLNTMRQDMIDAGFEEVKEVRFKWPIGGWPRERKMKEIGRYNGAAWDQGMEGWIMYLFTKFLDWKAEEVRILCAKVRKAIRDRSVHAYQDMVICYGRKTPARSEPEDPATTMFEPTAGATSEPTTGAASEPTTGTKSEPMTGATSSPMAGAASAE